MTNDNERRAPKDRRDEDNGPPHGWKDRRRRTERRIPAIEEQTISEDEWLLYFGGSSAPTRPELVPAAEIAATVFDKIRD
jgi:hypothetical protein